jgi:hypothetical protein
MYNQGVILLSVVLTGLDYKIRSIPQIGGVNYTMPLPHTSRAQTQDCNFGQPRSRGGDLDLSYSLRATKKI